MFSAPTIAFSRPDTSTAKVDRCHRLDHTDHRSCESTVRELADANDHVLHRRECVQYSCTTVAIDNPGTEQPDLLDHIVGSL